MDPLLFLDESDPNHAAAMAARVAALAVSENHPAPRRDALPPRWAFPRSTFYMSDVCAANARIPVLVGVRKVGQHTHTGAALHWRLSQLLPVRMHVTRSLWVWTVRIDDAERLMEKLVAENGWVRTVEGWDV